MKLKNISPLGDLDIARHGHVELGADFDVTPQEIDGLIGQCIGEGHDFSDPKAVYPGTGQNYEPADDEAWAALKAHIEALVAPPESEPAQVDDPPADDKPPSDDPPSDPPASKPARGGRAHKEETSS